MPFEINVPTLTGQITVADLFESGGVTPTNIISFGQAFGAHVEWRLCGFLAPFLPGNWRLSLLLESIGPGTEPALPVTPATIPLSSGVACPPAGCTCWTFDLNVSAGTVAAGTYKAVLSLAWEPAPGTPGPIAGFADLGLVQIYQP